MKKSQVRRSKGRGQSTSATGSNKANVRRAGVAQKASMLLIAGVLAFSASGSAIANDSYSVADVAKTSVAQESPNSGESGYISLTNAQRETIFGEANEVYTQAVAIAKTDSAEACDLFTNSATKYQLLVDSGIRNSQLYTNLGNAYLQSSQLGHAIVNYERARLLDPTNRQLAANLDFANSLVKGQVVNVSDSKNKTSDTSTDATSLGSVIGHMSSANQSLSNLIGTSSIAWTLAISSLMFWGLLTVSAIGYRVPVKRLAIVPLLLIMLSAPSYGLTTTAPSSNLNGIIVANNVTLRTSDGEQFAEVTTVEIASGHRVQIFDRRGEWMRIETVTGHTGWINQSDAQPIRPVALS